MKYSAEKIGDIAGLIWRTMDGKDGLSLKDLEKATGEKSMDLKLAIGWLFKEGKLEAKKVGRSTKLYLK